MTTTRPKLPLLFSGDSNTSLHPERPLQTAAVIISSRDTESHDSQTYQRNVLVSPGKGEAQQTTF